MLLKGRDNDEYDLDLSRFNINEDVNIKTVYFEKFGVGLN
jgi:hypothetical protein